MAKLSYGTGSVRIQMDDTLERIYRRAIEKVAPGILPEVERATDDIFDGAYGDWPVKTGHSKKGLERHTVVLPGNTAIRGTILNPVIYARYIKAKSLGGKSAFVELLRKPLRARAKELAKVIGRISADVLGGGNG